MSDTKFGRYIDDRSAAERRAAAAQEQQQLADDRQQLILAQSSLHYDPQHRIELWERLHAMNLPRAANHQLVDLIATQTALTVAQVREEQIRRAAAAGAGK